MTLLFYSNDQNLWFLLCIIESIKRAKGHINPARNGGVFYLRFKVFGRYSE
jgi:hypothetical protein